jgi:hypothetical protein
MGNLPHQEKEVVAQTVCAGWADAEEKHPCGKVLGQIAGNNISHGICPNCYSRQLRCMGYSAETIRRVLGRQQ